MERSVFSVFLVALFCVFYSVEFVKAASMVTTANGLTMETHFKPHFKKAMVKTAIRDTSRRRKRSVLEQGGVGQTDVCADILGPKWNTTKQGKSPCPTLVVWVPKKVGFTEFVEVDKQSNKVKGGFSIAIFCHALAWLPFNVQPIFKPFINDKGESNGNYDQLLHQIEGKTCESVAGDVTIRANRAQYVDFTIPYLSADIYMLVNATTEWKQSLGTFLKPFSKELWITLVAACIFTGSAIAYLEYRVGNPQFPSPLYKNVIMVIWYPISTFFFSEGKIRNKCSKVVLVLWLCMIFLVIQIFTATLSAWLTLNQLRPKLPSYLENVGYPKNSYMKDFLTQYNCSDLIIEQENCSFNLVPLNTAEEYKNALSKGTVDVIFHELHHIDLFLAKYGSDHDYVKYGPINLESGLAFAFPIGSPLLSIFSRAVINVTESETMMLLMKKYLAYSIDRHKPPPNQVALQRLDVRPFTGLFLFMLTVTLASVIWSEISLRRPTVNNKIQPLLGTDDKEQGIDLRHVYLAHMGSFNLLKVEMENDA